MSLLTVHDLSKHFDGVTALDNIDLSIREGEIRGIIGPNGSGKTTFINLVCGALSPSHGSISFNGKNITNLKPHLIVIKGISRTFQIPKILPEMTCLENVMLGCHCKYHFDILGTWLRIPFTSSKQEKEIKRKSLEMLEFVGLGYAADRMGNELSWVEEQLLQIGRALISKPRLLFLDEPTAGMGESESGEVQKVIKGIQQKGITTVIVAHDMNLISKITDQLSCLSFGTLIADGECRAVLEDPKVYEVYLGTD
jgi:branched-chain amino acid transport system ATP-binding protein